MANANALAGLTIGAAAASALLAWGLQPVERIPGGAMPDREILCQKRPGRCTVTMLVRLEAAPFPYTPSPGEKFWAGKDAKGDPYRRFRDKRYPRRPHYADDRVLVHVTPHRPNGGPRLILLYLHGHNADLRRDVIGRRQLVAQVNASGRNILLIAPQMAWRAIDSHPGKLGSNGGGARLVKAAIAALSETGDGPASPATSRTGESARLKHPVIVATYSGGWRAAMWVALRGELGKQLRGVVLLDALFGPVTRWAEWKADDGKAAFLVSLAGRRTVARGLEVESLLLRGGARVAKRLPAALKSQAVFLETLSPHVTLPVKGPPRFPIAEILKRVSARPASDDKATPDPAELK